MRILLFLADTAFLTWFGEQICDEAIGKAVSVLLSTATSFSYFTLNPSSLPFHVLLLRLNGALFLGIHIHPRYPLLLRFFFSDVSVHRIEALGSVVERKERKTHLDEKRKVYHYCCFTAVSLPLFALTSRLYTSLFFPCHHCSFLLVGIIITITLFFLLFVTRLSSW